LGGVVRQRRRENERAPERHARRPLADHDPCHQLVIDAVPHAQPLADGRVHVEGDELAHAERRVAFELLGKRERFARVARREHFDREIGRSFFPDAPRLEHLLRDTELHEAVGREAAPRVPAVEVHELIAPDGAGGADDRQEDLVQDGAQMKMTDRLPQVPLRLRLWKMQRLRGAHVANGLHRGMPRHIGECIAWVRPAQLHGFLS